MINPMINENNGDIVPNLQLH